MLTPPRGHLFYFGMDRPAPTDHFNNSVRANGRPPPGRLTNHAWTASSPAFFPPIWRQRPPDYILSLARSFAALLAAPLAAPLAALFSTSLAPTAASSAALVRCADDGAFQPHLVQRYGGDLIPEQATECRPIHG